MRFKWMRLVFFVVAFVGLVGGCRSGPKEAAKPQAKNVVLWISIDGLRGDYVDRFQPPFLTRLMREGAFTRQLRVVFPSLTFPSHVSEVTGVTPGVHGITGNEFYDSIAGRTFRFPDDPRLLQAEPIWETAARQQVRSAVFDWPLSYQGSLPEGRPRSAYFAERFDSKLTPDQRVDRLIEAYREDPRQGPPLQLLMGYLPEVDSAGHKFGPDSPQVGEALAGADARLERLVTAVAEEFGRRMRPERGDRLYVLVTTDHGMALIHTLVSIPGLLGESLPPGARLISGGSLAQIHLDELPAEARGKAARAMVEKLKDSPFVEAWMREDLPSEFGYFHPTRTGEVIVSARRGCAFTSRKGTPATFRAGLSPTENKATHGYRPDTPEMLGFAVLWRNGRERPVGRDLGEVDSLRLHPTVAALLGIAPAPGARQRPLNLEPSAFGK